MCVTFLPSSASYLLTLDGHKSRIGFEWLELCHKTQFKVLQAPADTSHFPQPCDKFANKAFQGAVRDMMDKVTSIAILNTKSVLLKLLCGIFGFHRIRTQYIRKRSKVTGLFPVDWDVSKRLRMTLTVSSTDLSNLSTAPQA